MNRSILFVSLLFLFACKKEYFPDENAYRDPNLIGTWYFLKDYNPIDSSGLFVFTADGYADGTYLVNNNQLNGFFNLGGLWRNTLEPDDHGIGKFYHASLSKHWTNDRWESERFYKISENQDTLLFGLGHNEWTDTLIRNSYQLIYDGPNYVGLDSIN